MTFTDRQIPDFEIITPDIQTSPVVFNSPHSGSHYRKDFIAASRLTPQTLRHSEDCFVDDLFATMPRLGALLLKANFPRAFLDVNRGPWELDPKMFSDKLPSYAETRTLRVLGGLGTIARNVSETEKIYRSKLDFTEAKARIERYYFPYHQALGKLIDSTRQQFGQTLLIDCHSMPSTATGRSRMARNRPDIILGDCHGTACDGEMMDILETLLTATGLKVTRNKPYAGGYITQTYGRPADNVHVIQIEINRGLYMDEVAICKNAGFNGLKADITSVFREFLQTIPFQAQRPAIAAE